MKQQRMFRFLRRLYPLRARLTCRPGPTLARTGTLATITLGALALHPTQAEPHADQPPLTSLIRAYLVFSLCSLPSLVDASPRILSFLSNIPVLSHVSDAFLKVTFFDQFVGAETIDACIPLLHKLHKSNQGVLFSYSVEHPSSPSTTSLDPSQRALESILRSIDVAADFEDSLCPSNTTTRTTGTWVAVKLSTLLPDPTALSVLSDWITHRHHDMTTTTTAPIPFPGAPDTQDLLLLLQPNNDRVADSDSRIPSLRTLHANLRTICARADSRGIRLTIDAEETWFQPAIDLFSVLLMQEFNSLKAQTNSTSTGSRAQPLVYTTLQAYLVRTPALLDFLIKHARENEYSLGVKLVRGAYIDAETDAHAHAHAHRALAHSCSISPDANPPTFPDKASTDAAYDAAVRVLVEEVARDVRRDAGHAGVAVLFGTHNWKSSRFVLDEIARVGLGEVVVDSEDKMVLSDQVRQRVCMAQLYGMSDSLAAYLVDRTSPPNININNQQTNPSLSPFVIRYVPYGPLRDVMPYLARRAVENRSVLGSSGSSPTSVSRSGSDDGSGKVGGGDGGREERGGAAEERRRVGRLIWERVVGFWKV